MIKDCFKKAFSPVRDKRASGPAHRADIVPLKVVRHLKYLFGLYLAALVLLLGSITATPLLVRHGFSLTRDVMIEEEILEAGLILLLLGFSMLIFWAFSRRIDAYRHAVRQAEVEKRHLGSRLTEAFSYIGTVNVEIQEIRSILNSVDRYPETRGEFKKLLCDLATRAMTLAGTPWAEIRIVHRSSGRTIFQCCAERPQVRAPAVTIGNRALLNGRAEEKIRTIATRQKNVDLLSVVILPSGPLAEDQDILVSAVVNQAEMLFMVYRSGGFGPDPPYLHATKEIEHVAYR